MADDFLSTFIGSPTKAKILCVFAFNSTSSFTLAETAKRAGVSSQTTAKEIQWLEKVGIIKKPAGRKAARGRKDADKKDVWTLNQSFKHMRAISQFVHEVSPVHYDNIVATLKRSGKLAAIILSGAFMGDPSRPADLIIAADGLNEGRLEAAVRSLEPAFAREIRYAAFSTPEFRYRLTIQDRLIRDTLDYPHVVLLDRTRLL